MELEVWIGLVGIVPKEGNSILGGEVGGAYVNVLCLAQGESDFQQKIEFEFRRKGFDVFDLEDVEPLRERIENFEVEKSLIDLADEVQSTGEVRCGTYHTFPRGSAN